MYDLSLVTNELRLNDVGKSAFRVLGIDLGTTNSAAAEVVVHPSKSTIDVISIEIEQETLSGTFYNDLVPSVVALHQGKMYVGEGARQIRSLISSYKLEQYKDIFWDTKNLIGVRRTFHRAPKRYRSAKEIAAHILEQILSNARSQDELQIESAVVTVPASFQFAQRSDTREAAELAGVCLSDESLLDEPVAAFIAYMYRHAPPELVNLARPKNLVVFDFGGGTCDVALFCLQKIDGQLSAAPLAVSRYHRLGGGDIDRAIAVDILTKELMRQNNLSSLDIDYKEKSDVVIPTLLELAESLKIGLCRQITNLKKFDQFEDSASTLSQSSPKSCFVELKSGAKLTLKSPSLTLVDFESVLKPFLDPDLLHQQESEYVSTCSIFAPLTDVLERAGLEPRDIDYCLAVGGSCLIPQIQEALNDFFENANTLRFNDAESMQTCVAHGAALQSLSVALRGRGIVQPAISESIAIRSSSGPIELIPANSRLPYPDSDDWASIDTLKVPRGAFSKNIDLRLELVDSKNALIMSELWSISPVVNKDDPLSLKYRMDANHNLQVRLSLQDDPTREFAHDIENPLTNIVNPNKTREKVLELEERMRTGTLDAEEQFSCVREIADLEYDLGNNEKALALLARLNRSKPRSGILHQMGLISGRMQDFNREQKFYRAAADLNPRDGSSLFNLALSYRRNGDHANALECVKEAASRDSDPAYLVLKAMVVKESGSDKRQYESTLNQALITFDSLSTMDEFQLHWYKRAATMINDEELVNKLDEQMKSLQRKSAIGYDDTGVLPAGPSDLVEKSRWTG